MSKKARMGRPPKPKDEKQGQRIMVSLTLAERGYLGKLAAKKGISVASLIMLPWRQGKGLEGK